MFIFSKANVLGSFWKGYATVFDSTGPSIDSYIDQEMDKQRDRETKREEGRREISCYNHK